MCGFKHMLLPNVMIASGLKSNVFKSQDACALHVQPCVPVAQSADRRALDSKTVRVVNRQWKLECVEKHCPVCNNTEYESFE